MKEENKKNSKNRRKLRIIIYFIIVLIILLLSLFGCKTCNDNKYRKILNNLPKINEEGYWIDKDNNKLTDVKSNNKNINSFEYYKTKDNNYTDSVAKFVKDYNSNNLKKFKIDFLNKDNSIYKSREYNFLDKLKFPQDPFEEGLIFKGWKILNNVENDNKLFTRNNKIIVDDNYTFKPVFNKIEEPIKDKFKLEFFVDEKLYKEFEVKKGEIIGEVKAPEKEGYIYQGWYDEFDNKFDPTKVIINKDYILKAKYYNKKPAEELNKYVVNIYDHNHILISSSKHKVDSVIELKRFTKDYVYEYYYDEDSSIDKYESIKDENYFNYVVTKDVNLIPKGHKKFIKFVSGSDEINIVNSNNVEIEDGKINVVTGENIEFAKVVKTDFYRLNKIVWQIDNNGVKQDFNDTVYHYNYDLTLYYKDDPNMFSDIYKIKELEDHIEITGLNDNYQTIPDFKLNIPSIINDKEVTTVGGFYNLTNINEVILPPTVKTLKKYCFQNSSITRTNIEESNVVNIGDNAFRGCYNLTKIRLPSSVERLGYMAFGECNSLTEIDLTLTSIHEIDQALCSDCPELETVKLPSSLKYIREYTFLYCRKLKNINLEDTQIETIGQGAFRENLSLKYVNLPSTCKYISKNVFYECRNLENVNLMNTKITKIEDDTFYNCRKLQSITIPNTLIYVGDNSFGFCQNLKSIDFSSTSLIEIGHFVFRGSDDLEQIILPTTLKVAKNGCFEGCNKLKDVNIEDTQIEVIAVETFFWCSSLKNIKLPHTVKSIKQDAFNSNNKITKLDFSETQVTELIANTIKDLPKLNTLALPNTLTKLYTGFAKNAPLLNKIEFNGTLEEFKNISREENWIENIAVVNPLVTFNDGTSCNYNAI